MVYEDDGGELMPTCMICGKWIDDGRTKFVGKRCECRKEYINSDGSTELRLIIKPEPLSKSLVVHKLHSKKGSLSFPLCGPRGGYAHSASRLWKDVTCKLCLKKRVKNY